MGPFPRQASDADADGKHTLTEFMGGELRKVALYPSCSSVEGDSLLTLCVVIAGDSLPLPLPARQAEALLAAGKTPAELLALYRAIAEVGGSSPSASAISPRG